MHADPDMPAPADALTVASHSIRDAAPGDSAGVSGVLAAAFPSLYMSTFGARDPRRIAGLLQALYDHGHLSPWIFLHHGGDEPQQGLDEPAVAGPHDRQPWRRYLGLPGNKLAFGAITSFVATLALAFSAYVLLNTP